MSDIFEAGSSERLIVTPAEAGVAGMSAEGAEWRERREFLRRLSIAAFAIPAVGGISEAADKKKKSTKSKAVKEAPSGGGAAAEPAAKSTGGSSKSKSASKPSGGSANSPETVGVGAGAPSSQGSPDAASSSGKPLPELYVRSNAVVFETILTDEINHVNFLVNALGSSARPIPSFQNLAATTVQELAMMARAFENTGTGAYLGALPLLAATTEGLTYVPNAGSIALIEARHSSYLNALLDESILTNAVGTVSSFEVPLTPNQVVSLVSPYVASLNGGPPLIPAGGLVQAVDILNFALALEYLEREFYSINLPGLIEELSK